MEFLYSTGLRIYSFLLFIASLFHKKARLLVDGRRNSLKALSILENSDFSGKSVWFHFASLGEFEQGRPVIENFKEKHPDYRRFITFYSPSGYEIRKDTPLADAVFYLPEDSSKNARLILNAFKPSIVIFTKYEYWHYFFKEIAEKSVPLYIISAIFREDQIYFKKRGSFFRAILKNVTHFFAQNQESIKLLQNIGLHNVSLTGDTRFDRVLEITKNPLDIPFVEMFINTQPCMVCGSTWPEDEKNLALLLQNHPGWKFLIAPHEIGENRIQEIEKLFPKSVRYSQLSIENTLGINASVLIMDNIGLLSSLYQFAALTYIGGGFGAGIHNTLEAAAYGKPVIFGPKYQKFNEAVDLIKIGAGFSYSDFQELEGVFNRLKITENQTNAGLAAKNYIQASAGATEKIMNTIKISN